MVLWKEDVNGEKLTVQPKKDIVVGSKEWNNLKQDGGTLKAEDDQKMSVKYTHCACAAWALLQMSKAISVIMDKHSIPATSAYTGTESVFAVANNVLLVGGFSSFAVCTGVTLLPIGSHWLNLALKCINTKNPDAYNICEKGDLLTQEEICLIDAIQSKLATNQYQEIYSSQQLLELVIELFANWTDTKIVESKFSRILLSNDSYPLHGEDIESCSGDKVYEDVEGSNRGGDCKDVHKVLHACLVKGCGCTFSTISRLVKHVILCHPNNGELKSSRQDSNAPIKAQSSSWNDAVSGATSKPSLKCSICDDIFASKKLLKKHMTLHNVAPAAVIVSSRTVSVAAVQDAAKATKAAYNCLWCTASFSTSFMRKAHYREAHSKVCPMCHVSLISEERLKKHMDKVHDNLAIPSDLSSATSVRIEPKETKPQAYQVRHA